MSRMQAISKFTIKAEHAETADKAMAVLETESAKEEGCFEYRCLKDPKEPGVYYIICGFEDHDAYIFHEESSHSKDFGKTLGQHIVSVEGAFVESVN